MDANPTADRCCLQVTEPQQADTQRITEQVAAVTSTLHHACHLPAECMRWRQPACLEHAVNPKPTTDMQVRATEATDCIIRSMPRSLLHTIHWDQMHRLGSSLRLSLLVKDSSRAPTWATRQVLYCHLWQHALHLFCWPNTPWSWEVQLRLSNSLQHTSIACTTAAFA